MIFPELLLCVSFFIFFSSSCVSKSFDCGWLRVVVFRCNLSLVEFGNSLRVFFSSCWLPLLTERSLVRYYKIIREFTSYKQNNNRLLPVCYCPLFWYGWGCMVAVECLIRFSKSGGVTMPHQHTKHTNSMEKHWLNFPYIEFLLAVGCCSHVCVFDSMWYTVVDCVTVLLLLLANVNNGERTHYPVESGFVLFSFETIESAHRWRDSALVYANARARELTQRDEITPPYSSVRCCCL